MGIRISSHTDENTSVTINPEAEPKDSREAFLTSSLLSYIIGFSGKEVGVFMSTQNVETKKLTILKLLWMKLKKKSLATAINLVVSKREVEWCIR